MQRFTLGRILMMGHPKDYPQCHRQTYSNVTSWGIKNQILLNSLRRRDGGIYIELLRVQGGSILLVTASDEWLVSATLG